MEKKNLPITPIAFYCHTFTLGGRGDLNKVTEIGVELGVLNCKHHRAEIALEIFLNNLMNLKYELSQSDETHALRRKRISFIAFALLSSKNTDQQFHLISKLCGKVLVADFAYFFLRLKRLYLSSFNFIPLY